MRRKKEEKENEVGGGRAASFLVLQHLRVQHTLCRSLCGRELGGAVFLFGGREYNCRRASGILCVHPQARLFSRFLCLCQLVGFVSAAFAMKSYFCVPFTYKERANFLKLFIPF